MQINFSLNKETARLQKDLTKLLCLAVEEVGVSSDILVNIALISAEEIQELNKTYRNVDKVTDVLSFPMLDNIDELEREKEFGMGIVNIGDIYINLEKVKEQAKDYGHSIKREFCFLALHGFLHLLGYDHMEKDEEEEMFKLQNIILDKAQIIR